MEYMEAGFQTQKKGSPLPECDYSVLEEWKGMVDDEEDLEEWMNAHYLSKFLPSDTEVSVEDLEQGEAEDRSFYFSPWIKGYEGGEYRLRVEMTKTRSATLEDLNELSE